MRRARWRELLRRLWYGSPTARDYCSHTCVLCGIEISHFRLDCGEAEKIYAPHVDCRPPIMVRTQVRGSEEPVLRPYSLLLPRNDSHLGAVEEE